MDPSQASQAAEFVRSRLPEEGLFAGLDWRIAPSPFELSPQIASDIEKLGRILHAFYRAINLLYRQSTLGKQPEWIAAWLDQGKPRELVELQRSPAFKNETPRVIRPDLLLTEEGLKITELDSVPGGIGLTGWLNQVYSELPGSAPVLGGPRGMVDGFASIFAPATQVHIVISAESATYVPEMQWLIRQLPAGSFAVRDVLFTEFSEGDAVYRFFELFDLPNIPAASKIFELASKKQIRLTPTLKPIFEEKLLFALLWNRRLRGFWRQELGASFFDRLLELSPTSWVIDPTPLPPQGAFPDLNLVDWRELKTLSQKERDLILKISGFHEHAWGARSVSLGSDLSLEQWSEAVDQAIDSFGTNPYVLQRYEKPSTVPASYVDLAKREVIQMAGRARLCPYYFVSGDADSARPTLGGVLATICPADKKIIHGMTDAILAPCSKASPGGR